MKIYHGGGTVEITTASSCGAGDFIKMEAIYNGLETTVFKSLSRYKFMCFFPKKAGEYNAEVEKALTDLKNEGLEFINVALKSGVK